VKNRLPNLEELLGRGLSFEYINLYEIIMIGVKTNLTEMQKRVNIRDTAKRDGLLQREEYMANMFGENSQQRYEASEAILRFDDIILRNKATKFREFLDINNEKSTRAFCRLSKEGGTCDDLTQIKDDRGNNFSTEKERGVHITGFYSKIYKKRLDNLIRIEDFIGREITEDWIRDKQLSEEEKANIEGIVTMEEVKKALDGSNFGSSSGWDGITFKVIRKLWEPLKHPMLKMIRETFEAGELTESFKLGLIRLIPKKGDASKVGDWRPITLLCCGYKLISGIVANRLERYLYKIIGRAQKGFRRTKNINTCTVNIMNSITRAWNIKQPTGIMCVDFSKAFDSVEHEVIGKVLKFFGFGDVMLTMVLTLLKDRKSRVILDEGYSESIVIERGTPQGDRSSPYIFILCIEILLIKLRLQHGNGINDAELFMEIVRNDPRYEPMTGEAYADDLTIIF
jgi:hypothetical protein